MSEETWDYKGYLIAESPASGQPAEPFTYVFRISRDGAAQCTYTIRSDAASIKAHWSDIDPARVGDIDAIWAALSSEGYVRIRSMIDSGALSEKTLVLKGHEAIES